MFKRDDVVRFADGNGKMHLWGDNVEVDHMFVTDVKEDGWVVTEDHPYTFTLRAEELVKVGEKYQTEYRDGDEIYSWLPELND